MSIKPTGANVVVEPLPLAGKSAGGIVLPETHVQQAAVRHYVVKAVGPKCVEQLQPGNVVLAPYNLEIIVDERRGTIVCEESRLIAALTSL